MAVIYQKKGFRADGFVGFMIIRNMGSHRGVYHRFYCEAKFGKGKAKQIAKRHDALLKKWLITKILSAGKDIMAYGRPVGRVAESLYTEIREGSPNPHRRRYLNWTFRSTDGYDSFRSNYREAASNAIARYIARNKYDDDLHPLLMDNLPGYAEHLAMLDAPYWRERLTEEEHDDLVRKLGRAFKIGLGSTKGRCMLPILPGVTLGVMVQESRGNRYPTINFTLTGNSNAVRRGIRKGVGEAFKALVQHPCNTYNYTVEDLAVNIPTSEVLIEYLKTFAKAHYDLTNSEVKQLSSEVREHYTGPDTAKWYQTLRV